jgi:hypothetical protein
VKGGTETKNQPSVEPLSGERAPHDAGASPSALASGDASTTVAAAVALALALDLAGARLAAALPPLGDAFLPPGDLPLPFFGL